MPLTPFKLCQWSCMKSRKIKTSASTFFKKVQLIKLEWKWMNLMSKNLARIRLHLQIQLLRLEDKVPLSQLQGLVKAHSQQLSNKCSHLQRKEGWGLHQLILKAEEKESTPPRKSTWPAISSLGQRHTTLTNTCHQASRRHSIKSLKKSLMI